VNLAVEEAKALKREAVLLFVIKKGGFKTHIPVSLNKN
jgi:hypothetical protein